MGPLSAGSAGPPLGGAVQVAYLVADLDEAVEGWSARGTGPFLRRPHVPVEASRAGRPVVYDHSIALAQWGGVMLELVQVHRAEPEELVADLATASGVHHVAEFVASVPDARRAAEQRGWPVVLDLRTASGGRVAFADARGELGHLVEYYEPTPALLDLYRQVAGLADAAPAAGRDH